MSRVESAVSRLFRTCEIEDCVHTSHFILCSLRVSSMCNFFCLLFCISVFVCWYFFFQGVTILSVSLQAFRLNTVCVCLCVCVCGCFLCCVFCVAQPQMPLTARIRVRRDAPRSSTSRTKRNISSLMDGRFHNVIRSDVVIRWNRHTSGLHRYPETEFNTGQLNPQSLNTPVKCIFLYDKNFTIL